MFWLDKLSSFLTCILSLNKYNFFTRDIVIEHLQMAK